MKSLNSFRLYMICGTWPFNHNLKGFEMFIIPSNLVTTLVQMLLRAPLPPTTKFDIRHNNCNSQYRPTPLFNEPSSDEKVKLFKKINLIIYVGLTRLARFLGWQTGVIWHWFYVDNTKEIWDHFLLHINYNNCRIVPQLYFKYFDECIFY